MEKQTKIIIGAEVSQAEAAFKRVQDSMGRLDRAVQSASSGFKNAFAGSVTAGAFVALGKQVLDAGLAMERLNAQFRAVTGSTGAAAAEFGFVQKEAARLGLDVTSAAESFARFTASTRGTNVEGQATRDIFVGVAEAATALKLSTEETNGIFIALRQMMSKGTVQSEELVHQLGDRFPGALQMAADAMGVTTAKLLDMMQNKEVLAEDLLPKLAARLHETYGKAATEAAQEAQSSTNRFKNEVELTAGAFGERLTPALATFLNALTPMVSEVNKFARDGSLRYWADEAEDSLLRVAKLLRVFQMSALPGWSKSLNALDTMKNDPIIADIMKKQAEIEKRRQMSPQDRLIEDVLSDTQHRRIKTSAPPTESNNEPKGKSLADLAEEHRLAMMKQEEKEAEERRKRAEAEQSSRRDTWQRTTDALKQLEQGLTTFGMDEIGRRLNAVDEWESHMHDLLLKAGLAHEEYEENMTEITRKATAERAKIADDAYDEAIQGTKKRGQERDEDPAADFWKEMNRATANWGKDLTMAIDDALMGGKGSWDKLLDSFADSFRRIVIDELISKQLVKALQSAMDSIMGGGSGSGAGGFNFGGLGGLFSGGSLSGFLNGGGLTGDFFNAGLLGSSGFAAQGAALAALFHDGGYVVPRFHSGIDLRRDEVPAILQTGEGVLSRRGMTALDMLNSGRTPSTGSTSSTPSSTTIVIQAMDSDDVRKFFEKHSDLLVGHSINNINRNGALRSAIASAT